MSTPTDRQLLARYVSSRSDEAFAELLRRHADWVYSAARRLVRDPQHADDVTQAVFILLTQKAHPIRDAASLRGWLLKVTRYTADHILRSERRRQRHERRAAAMRPEASGAADPQWDPQWEQISAMLDELVARLPFADRDAILLRFYQRKSMAEVGAELAVSEDTANKRVARATERLRGLFARRGVTLPAAALGATLIANITQAAPVAISAVISSGAAKAAPAKTLASIVARLLFWSHLKTAAAIALGVAVIVPVAVVATRPARQSMAATQPTRQPATTRTPAQGQELDIGLQLLQRQAEKAAVLRVSYSLTEKSAEVGEKNMRDGLKNERQWREQYIASGEKMRLEQFPDADKRRADAKPSVINTFDGKTFMSLQNNERVGRIYTERKQFPQTYWGYAHGLFNGLVNELRENRERASITSTAVGAQRMLSVSWPVIGDNRTVTVLLDPQHQYQPRSIQDVATLRDDLAARTQVKRNTYVVTVKAYREVDGILFPSKIDNQYSQLGTDGKETIAVERSVSVEDFVVNPPDLNAALFTIQFAPDTTVQLPAKGTSDTVPPATTRQSALDPAAGVNGAPGKDP